MAPPELTPWDKVQLARHPRRPHTLDYVRLICTDFIELHGDRRFGEDTARLRRSLVDYRFMGREGGGGEYWRLEKNAGA